MTKVRFLKSVTCAPYYLAYSVGQIGEVTNEMVELLLSNDAAEIVSQPKPARKKKRVKDND